MRGRTRKKNSPTRSHSGEPTAEREALERRWHHRTLRQDHLARLVTGESLADEPFHRWLPFKQAFAPELVRRFLAQADGLDTRGGRSPLLDPFAGSGTMVVECARNGLPAIGVEALASLVFVASAKAATAVPAPPDLSDCPTWQQIAEQLEQPDDVRRPLAPPPQVYQGDARRLESIADRSIGGILTSPPYLSRHDYTRSTRPHEMVYRYWHAGPDLATRRANQVRAHPKAYRQQWTQTMPPAVIETCTALDAAQEPKLSGVVRSYFEDLFAALRECHRVLTGGAPLWLVIGGARLKGIYVPTDLILAEFAERIGLTVVETGVARRLIAVGRNFGNLRDVAPRESILLMRKQTG